MTTCTVWSDVKVRLEVGLMRGADPDNRTALAPGRDHATFQLHRGINTNVPRVLFLAWVHKNRKYLECIKQERIRIVESGAEAA